MKKNFIILNVLLFLITSAVHGQITQTNTQFPNPGFEKWNRHNAVGNNYDGTDTAQRWVPFNWHTFDEASCSLWAGCGTARNNHHNSVNYKKSTMEQFNGIGTNNSKYIGIRCASVLGVKANGALSTGQTEVGSMTATNAANYNYSSSESSNYSSSGQKRWPFVGCPDSMAFYYYTSMSNASVQPLFKVFLHETGIFRDRADGSLCGKCDNNNNVRLIASSVDTFSQSSSWKREVWPFKYTKPGTHSNDNYTFLGQTNQSTDPTYGYYTSLNRPSYMLASFSTDKKAGNSIQTSGDLLFIDELWCIYDKGLNTLTIDGTSNTTALNVFNAAEFATHEPSRTYDASGNPVFNNSGSETWNYPGTITCTNIPQVAATPKSKLITDFSITQASAENGFKATIYVKHNDNSTFYYYIQFTPPTLPTITLNNGGTYTACEGDVINVTASGASSYEWSNGLGNTATVHPTTSGTYTVTGTASNGCTGTAMATVTVNPLPAITLSNNMNQTVCLGTSIDNITATFSGGTVAGSNLLGMTFNPNNGVLSGTPNGSGQYTITVTSAYTPSCGTASASGTITVNPQPTASLSMSSVTTCEGTAITPITVTTSGGTVTSTLPAGLSYNPQTGKITGIPTEAGTITITTTSTDCGTATANCTVTLTPAPSVSLSSNKNQDLCNSSEFTPITVTFAGGNVNVSGLSGTGLSYSNGSITGSPTAGTHTYYVTVNSTTCGSVSDTGTIVVNSNPTVTLSPSTVSVCQDAAIEGVAITPYNNTTTVSDLPTGLSFNNNTGLITGAPTVAGTFPITVTTTTNCGTATTTGTITVKPLPTVTLSNSNIEVCEGEAISPVTVTSTNSVNSNTVNLSNGLQFSGLNNNLGTIMGVPATAGAFTITVNSSNQCGTASATGTVTLKTKPTVSITGPTSLCQGVTETFLAEGNFVSCQWEDNSENASRDITPNQAGQFTYSVNVTGSNGCTNDAATTVTVQASPATPNVTTVSNSSCQAPYTGSITVTSPTGNYTYSIDGTDFQSATTFNGLSAGDYTLTVMNAAGCTSSKVITVGSTGSSVTVQPTANTPCAGGTLELTGNSSSSGVTYLWSGPNFTSTQANPIINNVTTANNGTYTLTVTETATGCTSTSSVNVTVNPLPTVSIAASVANPTVCPGTTLNIMVDGQNGTLTANGLPEGVSLINGFINGTVNTSGTYHYTVTNTSNCGTDSVNGTITVYNRPVITFTGTPSICQGSSTTIGVAETYNNYTWSNNSHNKNITVNTAGSYSVTVTDGNGCQNNAAQTVTMSNPPATPTVSVINNTNCSPFNGVITVIAPVGDSFTYSIDGDYFQSVPVFNGLESDEYSITVQDGNGCQSTLNGVLVDDFAAPVETEVTVNIAGNSYEWNGNTYTESGDYTATFVAATGCDSIVTLHLTMLGQTDLTQTIALTEGFNWVSFNLEITLNDLKAALVAAAPGTQIQIKGQSNQTTYNPNNHRWTGNLTWDVTKMFMIKVSTDCEITLEGMPIDPADHPVTMVNGNNYLGFPLNQSKTLQNAFAGFAVQGDQITSQTGVSVYNRNRWQGNIPELQPGKGYIYKTATARTLVFPSSAR